MSPSLLDLSNALFSSMALFTLSYSLYNLILFLAGIRARSEHHGKKGFPKHIPSISLIIPVKDEEKVIGRLLESLLRVDYPKDKLEILIVEDGSSDHTEDICLRYASSWPNLIHYFHRPTSSGKPAALNFALEKVKGEIIGVLDADSVPDENFLRRVAEHFEESGAAAIQGMTRSINARTNVLTRVASLEEEIWFKVMISGKERLGLFVPLTGSCQFIKAETLRKLGGWSESSLAEDVELAIRLTEGGYRIKFCRDVFSFQETSSRLSQMFKQRLRWYRGYTETAIEHKRLLGSLNRVLLDAELSLLGPAFLTFNFVSYLLSWLIFITSTAPLAKILACSIITLFSLPLLAAGFLFANARRSKEGLNLSLVPFIYAYWLLQTIIATYAVLSSISRRPKVWMKTEKMNLVDEPASDVFEAARSHRRLPLPRVNHKLNRGRGLRICFVTSHPPSRGRLSEYAVKVLRELEKSPIIEKVFVLSDSKTDPANSSYGQKIEVKKAWTFNNAASLLEIPLRVFSLRPHLVHFNVHFQSFGRSRLTNFIGLSLPFLCKTLGVPSIVSIHNLGERVELKLVGLKESLLNRLGLRFATKLITLASSITVTVKSYVEFLRRTYGCRSVYFVPHGAEPMNPRKPCNPHGFILMFGHMSPYKGLPLMLKTFDILLEKKKGLKLVIAGESHPNFPNYLESFKRSPHPNIKFTGYVDEKELPKLFQEAFVVVLPYLTATGTSGVFHLACGFGKPIVASDLPEMRELLRMGASAILVPPGDVEGFCKAILKLYDDPSLARKMGERNLSFASNETWSLVASSFERIYLRLASK